MVKINYDMLIRISLLEYEKISNESILSLLGQDMMGGGTIFVVNNLEENKLLGIIKQSDFEKQINKLKKVKYNNNFKYIDEVIHSVDNSKTINKYFYVPVLDGKKRLLYLNDFLGVSTLNYADQELFANYFIGNKRNFKNFFLDNNFKKICLIGNNSVFYSLFFAFRKSITIKIINHQRIYNLWMYAYSNLYFKSKFNTENKDIFEVVDDFNYEQLAKEFDLIVVDEKHYSEIAFRKINNHDYNKAIILEMKDLYEAVKDYHEYVQKINALCVQKKSNLFSVYIPYTMAELDESLLKRNELSKEMKDYYALKFPAVNYMNLNADIRLAWKTLEDGGENFRSEHCNFIDLARKVTNQPQEFNNNIFLVGPCTAVGVMTIDEETEETLGYWLQEYLNNICKKKYRVIPYNVAILKDKTKMVSKIQKNMLSGDIVVVIFMEKYVNQLLRKNQKYDFTDFFIKNQTIDIFYDRPTHTNAKGNEKIGNIIANIIKRDYDDNIPTKLIKNKSYNPNKTLYIPSYDEKSIKDIQKSKNFQNFIKNVKINLPKKAKSIGAIVMNANPFTKGHLHLATFASKKVDILIVFVVEEDRSFFPFKDRITLVKKGLSEIKNIYVFKSGSFIISKETFPDYFSKETFVQKNIDTSIDIEIFAKLIAKELNIKVRFVGEEPADMVTKQYNESMEKILPKHGIKFIEIPRKKTSNKVISASTVRKFIKENKINEIQKIVPESTYKYIIKNFSNNT